MTTYNKEIDLSEYYSLVRKIAHHLKGSLPDKFEVDDLIQTGMMGLIEARNTYSSSTGVPFEAYARLKIRGSIIDSVRKNGDHSRGFSKQSKAIYEATVNFEKLNKREPTEQELADLLGITLDKLQKFYIEANSMRFASIDEDMEIRSEDEDFDHQILVDRMVPVLERLNEQEKLVISLYYFEEMNLREIKEILDISEPRIHQIKGKALAKIKAQLL